MLKTTNLSKTYPSTNQRIIEKVSFQVKRNEFVAVIGRSGSGKTTLLRLLSGLEKPTEGKVLLNQRRTPDKGALGMVFQNYSCFPWLTARQNIAFGLELKGVAPKRQEKKVKELISIIGLQGFEDQYPNQLSGGMQQRVAIARAIATNPQLLLMDEPFGALDHQTRLRMQDFLLKVWEKKKNTILFVTHDIEEAIYLSDRILLLENGLTKEIKNPFARPRAQKLKDKITFIKLKRNIQQQLE